MASSSTIASSGRATRIAVFCVLGVLCCTSLAMEEQASSSSLSGPSSSSSSAASSPLSALRDQQLQPGNMRSYYYLTEEKRAPRYDFGVGKRWASDRRSQPFSLGLQGKRTRPYSFGLGKRSSYSSNDDDGTTSRYVYAGYAPDDLYEMAQRDAFEDYLQHQQQQQLQAKRGSRFNFGLGKRDAEMNGETMREDVGLHEKLPVKHSRDKYLFGLGKRFYEAQGDEDEDA